MRKLFGFAAAAVFATVIVGCGDKGGASGPVGVWVLDSSGMKEALRPKITAELAKQKAEFDKLPADQRAMAEKLMPSLDKMLDVASEQFGKMSMEMKLESGGAASFDGSMGGDKETGKGTWKQEGDKIVITPTEKNGKPTSEADKKDVPPLTFRDGKIWLDTPELSMPFKRK